MKAGTQPVREDLPKVLIIGDSISIGYTPGVRELLHDKAQVCRPDVNCGDTRHGLKALGQWLGDTRWDLIHFNWGLHDLCYRHPESPIPGNRDKVKGTIAVPLLAYRTNLETLVARLIQTGATLVWAHTTVVPEGEPGRFAGDERQYNAVAAEIMQRHAIAINDLHALTRGFAAALFAAPADVHYAPEGCALLARQVADTIAQALKNKAARKT